MKNETIKQAFVRARESGIPLIAVHRGTSSGMVFSNTAAASKVALLSGGDMVELDVVRSKDGVYFTFHDTYEPNLLNEDRNISQMTASEIRGLVYHRIHGRAGGGVETLQETLAQIPTTLVNVDRSYRYWQDGFLADLAEWADPEYLLIKSPPSPEFLEAVIACKVKYYYMAMVHTPEEIEDAIRESSSGAINLVAFEILASSSDDPILDRDLIASLRSQGFMIWFNAVNLENESVLCAGYDDNTAVHGDPHGSWGQLVKRGADVIQTDWPWLLRDYLEELPE